MAETATMPTTGAIMASRWTQAAITVIAVLAITALRTRRAAVAKAKHSAKTYEPGLLKKHSTFEDYETSTGHYRGIRTFYHPHAQTDKLPVLPLIVCMHGLGGSTAQFAPLLNSLVCLAPCLSIDLPGCGRSAIDTSMPPSAFTTVGLAGLLAAAVERFQDAKNSQKVILIGHSYGCSISVLLASSRATVIEKLSIGVAGLIAVCPRAERLTDKELSSLSWLRYVPAWLFDCIRTLDRIGGINARNVVRFVGKAADDETKKMQVRFNEQSRSETLLAMLVAWLPAKKVPSWLTSFPPQDYWITVDVPIYLIAAGDDKVTLPREAEVISQWLKEKPENAPHKMTVIPSASHGLIYTPSTAQIVAGLIQSFLSEHMDPHLAPAWQLRHLSTSGKWDVKNFAKWSKVEACSAPIGGVFRAMKTMRNDDAVHSPEKFAARYGPSAGVKQPVATVVDISHEAPVYNPEELENVRVGYRKLPTVSKEPPTAEEVKAFNALIDELREAQDGEERTIAIHCHYGFNRTGTFIVCYLVDRLGYTLRDAIDEFAAKRPPGIKHAYFVDELFVRYAAGMERRGTLGG